MGCYKISLSSVLPRGLRLSSWRDLSTRSVLMVGPLGRSARPWLGWSVDFSSASFYGTVFHDRCPLPYCGHLHSYPSIGKKKARSHCSTAKFQRFTRCRDTYVHNRSRLYMCISQIV